MDNKIALVYSNGEYTVNINGTLMHKGNDAEEMFEKFQNVIKNNSIRETTSWEYIKDRINEFKPLGMGVYIKTKKRDYSI